MGTKSSVRSGRRPGTSAAAAPEKSHEKVILQVLKAVKKGDFSARLPVEWTGVMGKIADELNGIIEFNAMFSDEFKRVSHVVGKKGQLAERASVLGLSFDQIGVRGVLAAQREVVDERR